MYYYFNCVLWCSVEGSGWSSEGLRTESVTKDGDNVTVTCSSNHLTSFAVLVDVGGAKVKQHIVRVHTCQKLNMFTVEPVLNNFVFGEPQTE